MARRAIAALVLILVLSAFKPVTPVLAFDASSTNFFVRQDITQIAGKSTSTNFWLFNNGSEGVLGLSTSSIFQVISGIIRALFQPVAPNYTLIHYHWRNDDGGEATSTSATSGAQDTILSSLSKSTTKRLRMEITNAGGSLRSFSSQQYQLQYGLMSTNCAAISSGSWINVGTGAADWNMSASTKLTEGADTTNIATSTGGVTDANNRFITPNGGVKNTTSTTGLISVPSDSFAELEYSVAASSSASAGSTYCFRVTNVGSTSNFTYTQYPQVSVSAAAQTISLVISPATVNLPGLSPGAAVTATSTATVTITGGINGYSLKIQRNSATSTLASSTLTFPDFTSWNLSSTSCASGQGNGTTAPGQTFSFRVQSASTTSSYCTFWWGNNDVSGTAIFAGVPVSTQTIVNATSSNNGTTATYILYRADAPNSQKATSYTGTVTITAITNL
ncbi:MAG: hypothetical protein ABSE68_02065 [Minisyncoccia bacterium]